MKKEQEKKEEEKKKEELKKEQEKVKEAEKQKEAEKAKEKVETPEPVPPPGKKTIQPTTPRPAADDTVCVLFFFNFLFNFFRLRYN